MRKQKAEIGGFKFFEHEIEIEKTAVSRREGDWKMTPHKSEACPAQLLMLPENGLIEPL